MNSAEKYDIHGIRHIMPMFSQWNVFYECMDKWIMIPDEGYGVPEELSPSDAVDVQQMLEQYDRNRMSYFLPHGKKVGGGLDFLNDYENEICMLVACNRAGKSCHGNIFTLLRTIKCDPNWHIFQHHGVTCPDYEGKSKTVISSYDWTAVNELWDEYMKWLPRELVGNRLVDWGKYPDENGKPRPIDLKQGKLSKIRLTDGNEILFRCDKQAQGVWEAVAWKTGHMDEQRERSKFVGYLRGTTTIPGKVQCCFTLTGHALKDRPDTGAGGWLKRELWDGKYNFGRGVGRYTLDIPTTPDVIISREEKEILYQQWVVEPNKAKNTDMLREAEARYWGRWQSGSGLVIENYEPHHHVVPAQIVDFKQSIFKDATKYRGCDHGLSRPATCAWCMVFPWGDVLMYREYYEPGKTIPYHAKQMVQMSGNERQKVDMPYIDQDIGESFDVYEEVQIGEVYAESVMDSRSFASPGQESDRNIGQLYNDWGFECSAAAGHKNEKLVPLMQAYFDLDPQRPHLMHQLWKRGAVDDDTYRVWLKGRDGEYKNAPRLYFVSGLDKMDEELCSWAINPNTGRPMDKFDHLVGGALKYLIATEPTYWGSNWRDEHTQKREVRDWDSDVPVPKSGANPVTGY